MSGATKADRSPLGGLKRAQVIRDLALSGLSQTALAEKYGVTPSAISQFASKHREQIADVRADSENEYAGILIAQKARRLAAYEELYETALTPQPKVSPSGKIVKDQMLDPDTGQWVDAMVTEVDVRAAAQVLKQAAEEMGQLPTRLQIQGDMQTTTTYRIEGASPDDLK